MVYPIGEMNKCLFTRVLHQLPKKTVIVPFFRGESMLHPFFSLLINKLKGYHEVQLATNGDYLTPQNKQAIFNACTFISVSLHTYTLPSQTRLPTFFYDALGHNVETQVSIVDTLLTNKTKRKHFIQEWKQHVDRVRIYKIHSNNGFGSMNNKAKPTSACDKPFREMIVYWNGRVGLCNHDWNNQTLLGDLNVQTVEQVWRSELYKEVRKLHRNGKRGEVPSCQDCSFESNHSYGELIENG